MTTAERTGRPTRPEPAPGPMKHVIAEYKHQAQTVLCVCGWFGSTVSLDGRTSDWSRHVVANRTK